MLSIIKQKSLMFITFMIFYLGIEMITFHTLGFGFIPSYLILDLIVVALIGSIIFLFKSKKVSLVYLSLWILFFVILYLTNATMFKIYGDIFSVEKLLLLNEATQVFEWSFIDMTDVILSVAIFLGFIGINCYFMIIFKSKKDKIIIKHERRKRYGVFFISLVVLIGMFVIIKSSAAKNIQVNGIKFSEKFYVNSLKKSAFKYYGMLTFYYEETEINVESPDSNDDIYEIHNQEKSPYYGLLKGKNVITIMIETGQTVGVNKYLTPNLYRLKEEGLDFYENTSKNKTNVSEHIGIAGNYPTTAYNVSANEYTMPFTVPNVLKGQYVTSYFHDNNGQFYHRDDMMPQLGFDHYYLHDDLYPDDNLPNWHGHWNWTGDYTLDSETIDRILPHMIYTDKPFYSFWTTLSMHEPYTNSSSSNRDLFISKGYYAKIENAEKLGEWTNPLEGDPKGEIEMKYYEAAVMDLDVAVGKIIDALQSSGELDNTILILYGDHNIYTDSIDNRINNLPDTDFTEVDKLYKTILYMWNPTLNERYKQDHAGSTTINTFSSPYVIVPTLLDLLGEKYNSDWYLDYSIFDKKYIPVFYSHELGALMNNVLYTEDAKEILYQAHDVDQAYVDNFFTNCLEILQRQQHINDLYARKTPKN